MAQAGYTPIKLYYSATTTNQPLPGDLAYGELGINITDGKLFYKDNVNAIQVIGYKLWPMTSVSGILPTANGGTNLGGATPFTANGVVYASSASALATGSVLTFNGTILSVNGVNVGRGAGAVSNNTAVGANALASNTTGSNNSAFGLGSLFTNGTGGSNTAIGTTALYFNNSGTFNAAIGVGVLYKNTGGSSNSAVGLNALYENTTGSDNAAIGSSALYNIATGNNNTALGSKAGENITSGSNNTILGYNAQASATSVSNEITLGNSSVTTLRCQVTSITSLSDQRDKHSIEDLPVGLNLINALRPRRYKWDKRDWYKNEVKREDGTTNYVSVPQDGSRAQNDWNEGFVAQEAKAALATVGASWFPLVYETNPEKLEMSAGKLIPVLVKAIQELTARLEALEAK
tara:strand:- start:381 stop:1595 length:1215 start_codon:yes stop_codon:yes gene_type:complete